jgi:uncharacterized protein with HEPN domain
MRSESDKAALRDIRDNIRLAREFVEGLTYEQFRRSRLHVYAVTRTLEIVSEASRRLPEELRQRHSHLPWRAVKDVGNLYRHEYDNVLESYLWATVEDHLRPLLAAVEAEIAAIERGGS